MKEGTINFTIGDGFGVRLMEIAQEQLLYELSPVKALNTLTGSLVGMSIEYALKILSGEVIVETIGGDIVNTRPRNTETDEKYPLLDAVSWYKKEFNHVGDAGRGFIQMLDNCLRGIVDCDGIFNLEISYQTILQYFYSGNHEELLCTIKEQTEFEYLSWLLSATTKYLKRTYSVGEVMKFLRESYPDIVNSRNGCVSGRYDVASMVAVKFNSLTNLNIDLLKEHYAEIDAPIINHIKAELGIKKELENEIRPLPASEKRSSGWVSPEGYWYGLDGEISNLLHITLADMLRKKILRETGTDIGNNPYAWLESNGWAKLTGNWALFDGYSVFGDRVKHSLTEKQKEFIKDYCNLHYKGVVRTGYSNSTIPAARLTIVDDFAVEKYFRL